MNFFRYPKAILGCFLVLGGLAAWSASTLTFSFDFEQFFPSGDPELEFYLEFREKFEGDDNFLLIALPVETHFFEPGYLARLDALTNRCQDLPYVELVSSPTSYRYAILSPFGLIDYPAIHLDEPDRWAADSARLAGDNRVNGQLFSRNFQTAVIAMKTLDRIDLAQSDALMEELDAALENSGFKTHHLLGRANFQSVLVAQQKQEFILSTAVSALLVFVVFLLAFRKPLSVFIGLFSVLLSMVLFLGVLGLIGRPLDFMAMLYPVLMIIVGVSDVVHINAKFVQEIRGGKSALEAMRITRREIGMATFLTSLTTAIGFLTLITSRVPPVRSFGWAAAIGVMVAYLTVILFTTAALSLAPKDKLYYNYENKVTLEGLLGRFYHWVARHHRKIGPGLAGVVVLCGLGMSLVSTDVRIYSGLPRGYKITEDFKFFEQHLAGFRPLEIAAIAAPGHSITDYDVLKQIDQFEQHLASYPELGTSTSILTLYKSINRAAGGDRVSAYHLAEDEGKLKKQQRLLDRLPEASSRALVSEDGKYARISTTILDIGTDSIRQISEAINAFAAAQTDTSLVTFKQTGTGILFDKNNVYLRKSLISGLGIAFLVIGLLMGALFRSWKMILVSLVPNILPILIGAAVLGFFNIALDASTAIIFSISFGIAVDDTIHMLSKFKLERDRQTPIELALKRVFQETGKAVILTSVILFFGFAILLFSATPGTNYVGLLIALTLFTALFSDLLLMPWLVRILFKQEIQAEQLKAESAARATQNAVETSPGLVG
ncbi:MAG: MMPL family transporter [Bacteroidetes bacterium]|nr:MMPL family transporter [Bacteroidota bacterium]